MDNSKKKNREKKIKTQKIIVTIIYLIYFGFCGAVGGYLLGNAMDSSSAGKATAMKGIAAGFIVLAVVVIAALAHIYIHETGHLIFGLLSGYKFQSIRFGSLMICKSEGKLKFAKYTLAGTGGQCLMTPPDVPVEKMPTALYNWGGIVMNILLSAITGVLFFVCKNHPYVQLITGLFSLVGIFLAFTNGVPIETMSNDGYNATHLSKDLRSKAAFRTMLLVAGELAEGKSVDKMPEEWFEWQFDEEADTSALAVSQGVTRLGWLVSMKRIEEAYELSTLILEKAVALPNIYQITVTSERLYCMIILNKNVDEIRKLYKENEKNFKSLRQLPSMLRVIYKYNVAIEKEGSKASETKQLFNKIAEKYPYPAEIALERELMDLPCKEYAKELVEETTEER